MIRYALTCAQTHLFEAWFSASEDFDHQAERGLVECPFCASREVRKQIMAPAVHGSAPEPAQAMMRDAAAEMRRRIERDFDYVGDAFAREARAIHEGENEDRSIYGEATPAEVRDLKADGVPCAPMPAALTPRRKSETH